MEDEEQQKILEEVESFFYNKLKKEDNRVIELVLSKTKIGSERGWLDTNPEENLYFNPHILSLCKEIAPKINLPKEVSKKDKEFIIKKNLIKIIRDE
jgi:hypothetical protein